MKRIAPLALLLLLGACATTTPQAAPPPRPVSTGVPATDPTPPPQSTATFRAPQVMRVAGLEGVIGSGASALIARFGTPRLDVREGDVRKLQFSGQPCVLDIYLYPMQPQAEPVATWVETRRASDGQDVDRAACVAALRR